MLLKDCFFTFVSLLEPPMMIEILPVIIIVFFQTVLLESGIYLQDSQLQHLLVIIAMFVRLHSVLLLS